MLFSVHTDGEQGRNYAIFRPHPQLKPNTYPSRPGVSKMRRETDITDRTAKRKQDTTADGVINNILIREQTVMT